MRKTNGLDENIRSYLSTEIKEHGHAVVTIMELAEAFGHSTSTVHASLRRQEREGKITRHPGRKNCYHEVSE